MLPCCLLFKKLPFELKMDAHHMVEPSINLILPTSMPYMLKLKVQSCTPLDLHKAVPLQWCKLKQVHLIHKKRTFFSMKTTLQLCFPEQGLNRNTVPWKYSIVTVIDGRNWGALNICTGPGNTKRPVDLAGDTEQHTRGLCRKQRLVGQQANFEVVAHL